LVSDSVITLIMFVRADGLCYVCVGIPSVSCRAYLHLPAGQSPPGMRFLSFLGSTHIPPTYRFQRVNGNEDSILLFNANCMTRLGLNLPTQPDLKSASLCNQDSLLKLCVLGTTFAVVWFLFDLVPRLIYRDG
jgi:hypothetical protein